MTISSFISLIESELPMEMALADDPVGTHVLPDDRSIRRVAAVYEIDDNVVNRAIERNVDLLVAFHPLIFTGLTSVTRKSRVERAVIDLATAGIAVHIVHTSFDMHPAGTSALLASELGLEGIEPLMPDDRRPGWGMGSIGWLTEPLPLNEFADLVRRTCGARAARFSRSDRFSTDFSVHRVACVGGSGMSFYYDAVRRGADALVTADVRYHAFHSANDAIPVVDPGHAETERFVVSGLHEILARVIRGSGIDVELVTLDATTNPVDVVT